MNIGQLRFVRAVVDVGTFTGGAARCHVSQSTLSTAISHLETELGDRLFARTTRSVALTPFGHRLLPLIDDVLRAQTALVDTAAGLLDPKSKVVRIGVCPLVDSTRLDLILSAYRKAHRDVRVVLEQTGDGRARHALEEGQLDFVLSPVPPARRSRFERAVLYEDPLVYLCAGESSSDGSDRRPVRVEDISEDEFLLVHDACGLTRLTRQLFRTRRLVLRAYEGQAVSYQVLEEWARLGVGSAILPLSKLSAPGLGRAVVLGNGRLATIRYEAEYAHSANRAPHLEALTEHLKTAGGVLRLQPDVSSTGLPTAPLVLSR